MGREIDDIANLGSFSSSSSAAQAKRFQSNQQRSRSASSLQFSLFQPSTKPRCSSPPPSLLRSVFTGVATTTVTLIITTTDHFSISQSMPLILSEFFWSCYSKLLCFIWFDLKLKFVKVVVMTRKEELVLCRGDVSNSPPSRLSRMLQSLTGMPRASFEDS